MSSPVKVAEQDRPTARKAQEIGEVERLATGAARPARGSTTPVWLVKAHGAEAAVVAHAA